MSNVTSTMVKTDAPEFYNTTPFQFDRSAVTLSHSVVVTTTITGPAGTWAGGTVPSEGLPQQPPAQPELPRAD